MWKAASKWLAILSAFAFVILSGYGWWFLIAVGEAHGAGMELGIVGAVLAVVAALIAVRLDRR